tara:strand:+ start:1239 stop:1403 length:165 start_codon:yes stop_codon:yes gene_type:complete
MPFVTLELAAEAAHFSVRRVTHSWVLIRALAVRAVEPARMFKPLVLMVGVALCI